LSVAQAQRRGGGGILGQVSTIADFTCQAVTSVTIYFLNS
jgi:hypothetical protein